MLKQGFYRVAALPIPQLRGDGIWDSAVPALGQCACHCPHKRGIIRLATMTTLPEHQSVDDCRRSLLLPRLKQLVTLRREVIYRLLRNTWSCCYSVLGSRDSITAALLCLPDIMALYYSLIFAMWQHCCVCNHRSVTAMKPWSPPSVTGTLVIVMSDGM